MCGSVLLILHFNSYNGLGERTSLSLFGHAGGQQVRRQGRVQGVRQQDELELHLWTTQGQRVLVINRQSQRCKSNKDANINIHIATSFYKLDRAAPVFSDHWAECSIQMTNGAEPLWQDQTINYFSGDLH